MYGVEERKRDREREKNRIIKLLAKIGYNADDEIKEDKNGEHILFTKIGKFGSYYEIKFYVWR